MSGADSKFLGRDVAVYWSPTFTDLVTPPGDFQRLGALRDKTFGAEFDTVDVTVDTSDGIYKQYLTAFKEFAMDFSGLISNDATDGQDALELYVNNTTTQPTGWCRIVRPLSSTTTRAYDIPVMWTSYNSEAPYAEAATVSITPVAIGAPIITDA